MPNKLIQELGYIMEGVLASRILVASIVGIVFILAMPVFVATSLKLTLFLMGFATCFVTYLINVYTDQTEDNVNIAGLHITISLPFILFVALSPIPLVLEVFGVRGVLLLGALFLIGILYSVKIPFLNFRIKDVFLLKNIYPGLAVVTGMVLLRALLGFPLFSVEFIQVFLIFFGIEIFYDIRDMHGDKPGSTLPLRLGLLWAKGIVIFTYLIVLAIYAVYYPQILHIVWPPVVAVIAITVIAKPNRRAVLFHMPVLIWLLSLGFLLCL